MDVLSLYNVSSAIFADLIYSQIYLRKDLKDCRNILIFASRSVTSVKFMCLQEGEGSVPEINPLALLPVLADFVQLKDPGMLPLEVSGLAAKYPDIR